MAFLASVLKAHTSNVLKERESRRDFQAFKKKLYEEIELVMKGRIKWLMQVKELRPTHMKYNTIAKASSFDFYRAQIKRM
jgi:hypothetical protein